MSFRVGLLGPLIVEVDGEELSPHTVPKKSLALLAYLAAQRGQPISRDRLADLLWPYQGSNPARHSLRNCLCVLRQALPAVNEHLRAERAHCRLVNAETDLDDFERLIKSHVNLLRVADLYRGQFLDDFEINSEPWSDWVKAERDRTRELAIGALQRLSELATADCDHKAAIQAAQRAVRLDRLSESSHQRLILAYRFAGLRAAARRAYNNCTSILWRELGVAPVMATWTACHQDLLPVGYRHHLEHLAAAMTEQVGQGAVRPSTITKAREALLTIAKLLPRDDRRGDGAGQKAAA